MRIYKRKGSPFWWYDFTWGGDRLRRSSGKGTRREAEIEAAAALHELQQHKGRLASGWGLDEIFGAYWQDVAQHRRTSGEIFRQLALLTDILGKATPIARITNAMLMDYRARRRGMARPSKTGPARAPKPHSINRELAMLRAALYHARDIYGQQIPAISWKRIMASEAPERRRFLSRDEWLALDAAAHPELRRIILAAVTTGLRRGNLLDLTWRDVSLSAGTITIARTKNGKPHQLRIAAPLRTLLIEMQAERIDAAAKTGRVPSATETLFDRTGLRRRWNAARTASGLADVRFHDLRHTFASWARQAGVDIADICEALNHSRISVTMRYAHIDPATHRTAFDAAAEMLDPAQNAAHSTPKELK